MLDIQFIRDNRETVEIKSRQKGYQVDVVRLLDLDEKRRGLLGQIDEVRAKRNELAAKLKQSKPGPEQIEQGKTLKTKISELENELQPVENDYQKLLKSVPNLQFDGVPIGGEDASLEIKKVGAQTAGAKDHLQLASERGWLDFERGAKVAGNKFYYLTGDLALLENAVTQFALQFVIQKGFQFMTVPHMVSSRILTGTGFAPRSSEQSDEYGIDGEDLSLIATAEIPLTGYHADEILDEANLPLMYVALSPCYRKEAGTYGKHTHGLFRVHQFNKLEMYAFCLPENSQAMHEQLLNTQEQLWQTIGIPYHIINIASGDLGAPAAKKYDIEYWSPVDGTYRELTSCSNCTDYQTRNLNIRVRRKSGQIEMLHSLNGTAAALARSLVAIIENFQTPQGKVMIPEVLRPFMGGKSEI
ncbi:MAG: serine--tRNA ligase [Candidatus Saccharimonadales bacterium]